MHVAVSQCHVVHQSICGLLIPEKISTFSVLSLLIFIYFDQCTYVYVLGRYSADNIIAFLMRYRFFLANLSTNLTSTNQVNCLSNHDGIYLQIIEELEVAGGLRGPLDSFTQGHCTGSTISPVGAAHSVKGSGSFGHPADQVQLRLCVCPAG